MTKVTDGHEPHMSNSSHRHSIDVCSRQSLMGLSEVLTYLTDHHFCHLVGYLRYLTGGHVLHMPNILTIGHKIQYN